MSTYNDENVTNLIEVFHKFSKAEWRKKKLWGLKASEVRLLICVKKSTDRNENGIKVSEISKGLEVTSPTVTQMINSLIDSGYVIRSTDSNDRRMTKITLTEKGDELAQKAIEGYYNLFSGMFNHLGKEESDHLIRLLNDVFQYFETVKANKEQ